MWEKQIPTKNYIKYGLIIFFTLLGCLILFIIYDNWKKYNNNVPILRNKVSEIEINDVDDYINENENILLYFGVVNDDNSEEIEKELSKMIDKNEINFIYVNITDLKNKRSYLKSFGEKYSSNKTLDNYPAFVYIRDGKIVDVVQRDSRYLEKNDIKSFVELNEIKGEKDA